MKSRKSITHSENRFAKGKGFDNIKPIFSFAEYKNSDLFKIEDSLINRNYTSFCLG